VKHPGRGGRPEAGGGIDDPVAPPAGDDDLDAPPPVGGSWERLYTGVILTLLLLIVAFWLFTRAYAP
jgi:hypothetical protein